MERSLPVREAMTVKVETAPRTATVMEVADIMVEKEVGSVVIIEGGEPVGIICERDLLERVISSDLKPSEVTAEDIMVRPLITTNPDTDMLDAMRTMIKNNIGHLPVVEQGELSGIVTVKDALEVTPRILEVIPERAEVREVSQEEGISESVCEICGGMRKPLLQFRNKWICEECRDFLVG